jgi:hypothetical protein
VPRRSTSAAASGTCSTLPPGAKVRESLHTADDEPTAIRRAVALRRERERTYKVGMLLFTWCRSWLCSYARDGAALWRGIEAAIQLARKLAKA